MNFEEITVVNEMANRWPNGYKPKEMPSKEQEQIKKDIAEYTNEKSKSYSKKLEDNVEKGIKDVDIKDDKKLQKFEKKVKSFKKLSKFGREGEDVKKDTKDYYDFLTKGQINKGFQENLRKDLKVNLATDPTKQTWDQEYTYNKVAEKISDGVKRKVDFDNGIISALDDKGRKFSFQKQGGKAVDKNGKIVSLKKDQDVRAVGTKSSDAYLEAGRTKVFCTFKSTNMSGGSQKHQMDEALFTISKIKDNKCAHGIAVLDGAYYFDKDGNITKELAEAIKKHFGDNFEYTTQRPFSIRRVVFYNIMPTSLFLDRLSKLYATYQKSSSVITEDIISEDDVLSEKKDAEDFLGSLNNIEKAMKEQNMNTSLVVKIKNGMISVVNKLKAFADKTVNKIKNVFKPKNKAEAISARVNPSAAAAQGNALNKVN